MSIEVGSTMGPQGGFMASQFDAESPVAEAPGETDDYEFNVYENAVILTLSKRIRMVGIVTVVFATLQTIVAIAVRSNPTLTIRAMIIAIVSAFMGAMLLGAAREFRAITETENSDVRHLMTALGKLSQFFLVQCVLFVITVVLLALLVVLLAM